jgi:uncharacterized membrane protein HdeD (DUF308 family)
MTVTTSEAPVQADEGPIWIGVVEGLALIVLGLLCLSAPGATLIVIVIFAGVYWLIAGILGLIRLLRDRTRFALTLVGSLLEIVAGILVIGNPLWSSLLVPASLVIIVGAIGVVGGVIHAVRSVGGRHWTGVVAGLAGILIGLFLLANSIVGAALLPVVVGLTALFGGLAAIVVSFVERRERHEAAMAAIAAGRGAEATSEVER